jgi:hypothetical protein
VHQDLARGLAVRPRLRRVRVDPPAPAAKALGLAFASAPAAAPPAGDGEQTAPADEPPGISD